MHEYLITPLDLAEHLLSTPPVVLDVRWRLGDPDGREHYRQGHIPGAVYVDLDTELAAPPSGPVGGRHPLPAIEDLQAAARRWGINDGVPVVVYDDSGNLAAARAWWLLRWAGHADVRLLDGGLAAWCAEGLRTTTGDGGRPRAGTVTLTAGNLPVATIDDVADGDALLVDARAGERYRGDVEPVDPRAGHIPGAVNAPTVDNIDETGRFRSADELRRRFAEVGVVPGDEREVVVYCGSGVNATHGIAALAVAGIDATLFPGSFSQWSSDPDRPVAPGVQR
ncbi:sulfurtransferase [Gordonia amicalis]|uniref:Sulfurtransferase n=1 Tax=Gordonia amicalis TaxID=89053 RepID=A0AAE4R150_9ACTN|nr:sulfurtransferase [Gordonia amicalis]MCZ0914837.1 sulfurtransferase [Gordonia amicalis]MCZ4578626.1 sulfurtransferase [Gordonia amicalis]MDV6311465.1 sulfurtransferase [Gordonia amicalis]MDV7174824.1 sulfurtransferase [Gordonia amicalis]NKX78386.1 sulfurtransferase [Gordonia amicalis]